MRHYLANGTGLAGIEQYEVFQDVQQAVLGQHAVEQHLGSHIASVGFVQALPFAKVLPRAGDGPKTRVVPVADDQEGIVVKRMRYDVFVHVVAQIAVKAGADVFVHRLQFDEHQGQAVDETHQVGAAVVVGGAQTGELEFAHHQKAVVGGIAKVDHRRVRGAQLSLRVAVVHRNAVPNERVKVTVVLQQRARKVVVG